MTGDSSLLGALLSDCSDTLPYVFVGFWVVSCTQRGAQQDKLRGAFKQRACVYVCYIVSSSLTVLLKLALVLTNVPN